MLFLPGFSKIQELKGRLREAEEKLVETREENAALEERIAQLRTDTDTMEMVARDRLGVVKKGETVIKIIRESDSETVERPAL